MTRANGSQPDDPLDDLDDVIAELEGSEWEDEEITAEHLIEAVKVGAAAATGKHRALGPDEPTPTDPPRRPPSEPPRSGFVGIVQAGGGALAKVLGVANNLYAVLALALLVAGFVAWLVLHR